MINAAFFDIFGFIAFIYIIALSIFLLRNKKLPKLFKIILLIIGILGMIVDGFVVIVTYLI